MGIENVLIDMDSVPYIDSTGVGFLVAHTSMTNDGGQLGLLKVNPNIGSIQDHEFALRLRDLR
jgi:anti-anti-sigma factor